MRANRGYTGRKGIPAVDWVEFIRGFGCVLIVLYLITGIDDTIWFFFAIISGAINKKEKAKDNLDFDLLRNTPPKMLAVSIAAWHEANVIEGVITNFLNTTDYPKSMYHLFVGVYPNDPDTIAAVESVSEKFPNVHPIINCKEGPTTKAQNINHVIRQIKLFEEENHVEFASLTIHDSEDVIHTYELLMTNYLIDKHDALQFPVFPIMQMPRFKNFFKQLTTATYSDEFAEAHYITMVQRRDMKAFVPCAGTGFAMSRKCILDFGEEDVLPSESLTEDYLLSLQLYKKGIPLHYVLNKLPRVMQNGKIKTDFVTTRSLFPATFRAAIKQKTRWAYGITMQSVGMKDVFKSKGVSAAGRYSFYKDLKAKYLNLVPLLGYLASVYCIIALIFNMEPLYRPFTPVFYMAMAVFVIMIVRQFFRGYALFHVYGFRSMFFGCLLPPLFPLRLIYGNVINFVATLRAVRMKVFGEKSAKKTFIKDMKKKKEKKVVKWAKTDHEFLSRDQLRRYRRMLGDTLIVQGYITAKQFNDALKNADKEHGEQIGAYLIRNGIITETQMIRALGHVKHIIFAPDEVVRRLDYEKAVESFDRETLLERKLLPLTFENGVCMLGICNGTKEEDIKKFQEENELQIRRFYVMESAIIEAFNPDEKVIRKKLDSLTLYHEGKISFEQVILIGIYSWIHNMTEYAVRHYMGIRVDEPGLVEFDHIVDEKDDFDIDLDYSFGGVYEYDFELV